jgi:hypothetical protein
MVETQRSKNPEGVVLYAFLKEKVQLQLIKIFLAP